MQALVFVFVVFIVRLSEATETSSESKSTDSTQIQRARAVNINALNSTLANAIASPPNDNNNDNDDGDDKWLYESQANWQQQFPACGLSLQSPIDIRTDALLVKSRQTSNSDNLNRKVKFLNYNDARVFVEPQVDVLRAKLRFHIKHENSEQVKQKKKLVVKIKRKLKVRVKIRNNTNNATSSRALKTSNNSNNAERRKNAHKDNDNDNDNDFAATSSESTLMPRVSLSWLGEFELRQVVFHSTGSEHTIDGQMAAGEIARAKKQASSSNNNNNNNNKLDLQKELDALERHANKKLAFATTLSWLKLNSAQTTQTFYTYSGSLTQPPCTRAVTWLVLSKRRLSISVSQLARIHKLVGVSRLSFKRAQQFKRQLQDAGDRFVRLSFSESESESESERENNDDEGDDDGDSSSSSNDDDDENNDAADRDDDDDDGGDNDAEVVDEFPRTSTASTTSNASDDDSRQKTPPRKQSGEVSDEPDQQLADYGALAQHLLDASSPPMLQPLPAPPLVPLVSSFGVSSQVAPLLPPVPHSPHLLLPMPQNQQHYRKPQLQHHSNIAQETNGASFTSSRRRY